MSKKRGPAPKPPEQTRTKRISVYLSDTEYSDLVKRIPNAKDLCNYIRAQVFAGKTPVSVAIPEINLKAYRDLAQAGSNLNQIARHMNANAPVELQQLLNEIAAFRFVTDRDAVMKGMQKISRGGSFAGVMAYAFDGDLDNPRELEGEVVGGNMAGRDPKALSREFDASKAVRPEVAKPVWHNSLRLPEGDKLTNEQWSAIGDAYMEKMGFSQNHQRVYVLHDDKAGQHIHIVASRVGLDGSLFLGKNENLISTKKIAELEKEFGLTITKGANYDDQGKVVMPDRSRPKAGEVGKFERTGESPSRLVLANLIDQAIADSPTASVFAERLVLAGVDVKANFSKDKLNGFSFVIDGIPFKGSQVGKQYSGKALFERGLSYEQDRDYAQLKQYSSAATEHAERDKAAGDLAAHESRTSSGPDAGDSTSVRGADLRRDSRSDPSATNSDSTSPGHSESSQLGDGISERVPGESSARIEGRDSGSEKHPGASQGRENQAGSSIGSGSAGIAGSQPSLPSAGGIEGGVELSDLGPMRTGDEATDNLMKISHKETMKVARESMARQKRMHAENEAFSKKMYAEAQATVNQLLGLSGKPRKTATRNFSYEMAQQRPYSTKLSSIAAKAADPEWRDREVAQFTKAVGANGFDLAFSDPSKKRGTAKKSLTSDQLKNPRAVRGLADHFARSGSVAAKPLNEDAKGLILLTGLTNEAIQDLGARGFSAAAVVEVAGKYQAWIRTDEKLTSEERRKLAERFSVLTDIPQKPDAYGRLPGFSKGLQTVTLVSASGHSAPGAQDLLQDIRAEIQDAKAALYLTQMSVARTTVDRDRDIKNIGGIAELRKGWFLEARDNVQADIMNRNFDFSNETIETKVLEAMARQKVLIRHAYQAVFDESRVRSGSEQYAAERVSHAYTRIALEAEGLAVAGVDIEAEARRRFPEIFKRAESLMDSENKAMQDRMKLDGQAEQMEIERRDDEQRLAKAMQAAERAAQEHKSTLTKG